MRCLLSQPKRWTSAIARLRGPGFLDFARGCFLVPQAPAQPTRPNKKPSAPVFPSNELPAFFRDAKSASLNLNKTIQFLEELTLSCDPRELSDEDFKNYQTFVQMVHEKMREQKRDFFNEKLGRSGQSPLAGEAREWTRLSQRLLANLAWFLQPNPQRISEIFEKTINKCFFFITENIELLSLGEQVAAIRHLHLCHQTSVRNYFSLLVRLKPKLGDLSGNEAGVILESLTVKENSYLFKKMRQKSMKHSKEVDYEKEFQFIVGQLFGIWVGSLQDSLPPNSPRVLQNLAGLK